MKKTYGALIMCFLLFSLSATAQKETKNKNLI